jgi:Holliday junction resolvasome RuvABC endonuclease subunit
MGELRILGADLSMNHAGFVLIVAPLGGVDAYAATLPPADWACVAQRVCDVDAEPARVMAIPKLAERNAHVLGGHRRAFWERYIAELLYRWTPTHVLIEDYAYDQKQGAHQMGEIGGEFRRQAWNRAIPLRAHEIQTLKMFAAGNGNATSEDVAVRVDERWGVTFGKIDPICEAGGDLAVAYSAARLGWLELAVASGRLLLEDIDDDARRQFLRVTKANPENLLARPWVHPTAAVVVEKKARKVRGRAA